MSVQLPPYMSLDHNQETRKASLNILDRDERKQREMWGTLVKSGHSTRKLTVCRHNPRLSE